MTALAAQVAGVQAIDRRTVTLVTAEPPLRVTALRGMDSPTVTGGFGGWDTVARPRKTSIVEWSGIEPRELSLPLLFDRHGATVEADIGKLERMTRPAGTGEPPLVRVLGSIPHASLDWVIRTLEFAGAAVYSPAGHRTRQAVTVRLLEYVADDRLSGIPAAERARRDALDRAAAGARAAGVGGATPTGPKLYTVKAGDTLGSIAAAQLGSYKRWPEIAALNGIRDPKSLQVGQVLRLP